MFIITYIVIILGDTNKILLTNDLPLDFCRQTAAHDFSPAAFDLAPFSFGFAGQ
jgi:hypothetical protein